MSKKPSYNPPILLPGGHLQTIYPAIFRRVISPTYFYRNRIETPDRDYLDVDFIQRGFPAVVLLSHGLEGNSTRPYIKGMINGLWSLGVDFCAWNFRGCSGNPNRQLRMYHSGSTDDLAFIVSLLSNIYKTIYLVGFSLGGNLTLKYAGEPNVSAAVKKIMAISVPVDLESSSHQLAKWHNFLYTKRFLRSLKEKIKGKEMAFPHYYSLKKWETIKNLIDFDEHYTAPIHGFTSAKDYYRRCSSITYIHKIKTPTLVLNAANDPFLSTECIDPLMADGNPWVKVEITKNGGHVGWPSISAKSYFHEWKALDFFSEGTSL